MNWNQLIESGSTRIAVVDNRLVGIDVLENGEESCLRSNLGTYASQFHALAMKLLWDRPDFLILASEGKITDEVVEKLAEGLRALKEKSEHVS